MAKASPQMLAASHGILSDQVISMGPGSFFHKPEQMGMLQPAVMGKRLVADNQLLAALLQVSPPLPRARAGAQTHFDQNEPANLRERAHSYYPSW